MILVGDIGGTNTRLALAEHGGTITNRQDFPSQSYPSLTKAVREFLESNNPTLEAASFGIAGPIEDDRCEATNLPWVVDRQELKDLLALDRVALLNDLEAAAHGIAALKPADYAVLNQGQPGQAGNAAVVAAGTGLGMAGLYWNGSAHQPFATEGGHVDFAPRNDLEVDLYRSLRDAFGRVTYERVTSGPGILNIYRFLKDSSRYTEEPDLAAALSDSNEPARVITTAALEKTSPLCEKTVSVFLSAYGAQAGNAALQYLAVNGVWLTGGIIAALHHQGLPLDDFVTSYKDKAPFEELVASIPVRAVLDNAVALKGAAAHVLSST
ncbi:MAG: glucokinase [Planctomycetota bacterium]